MAPSRRRLRVPEIYKPTRPPNIPSAEGREDYSDRLLGPGLVVAFVGVRRRPLDNAYRVDPAGTESLSRDQRRRKNADAGRAGQAYGARGTRREPKRNVGPRHRRTVADALAVPAGGPETSRERLT